MKSPTLLAGEQVPGQFNTPGGVIRGMTKTLLFSLMNANPQQVNTLFYFLSKLSHRVPSKIGVQNQNEIVVLNDRIGVVTSSGQVVSISLSYLHDGILQAFGVPSNSPDSPTSSVITITPKNQETFWVPVTVSDYYAFLR